MPCEKSRWAGFKAQSSQVHKLRSCFCCLAFRIPQNSNIQNDKSYFVSHFPKAIITKLKVLYLFKGPLFRIAFFADNAYKSGDILTAQLKKKSCLLCSCKVEINRHTLLIHDWLLRWRISTNDDKVVTWANSLDKIDHSMWNSMKICTRSCVHFCWWPFMTLEKYVYLTEADIGSFTFNCLRGKSWYVCNTTIKIPFASYWLFDF